MITEFFVSLDGFNFNKLDLDKSESIPLRLTYKDTQDFFKNLFALFFRVYIYGNAKQSESVKLFW
jgi:hypothetical protein